MTPRETVKAAFRFEETDETPYWIPMYGGVRGRLDAHYGSPNWADGLRPYLSAWHTMTDNQDQGDGTMRDAFGTVSETGNILHVLAPALPEADLAGYAWPDPETLGDWDAAERAVSQAPDSFHLYGLGYGLFERAWLMRGLENFLMDMATDERFTCDLLDGIMETHLRCMDLLIDRAPIDAYFGGDDWSDQRGPMMGLERWRKYFKPRFARLVAHAHERGVPYVCHSCGNVLPLIDDLLEIGLDGLESLQPEAMDVYELKRRVAGRMVLIGGLGTQSVLPFGTPDAVRLETERLARELGRGGGYVLAPSKPVMDDVPTENAAALIDTIREWNRTERG